VGLRRGTVGIVEHDFNTALSPLTYQYDLCAPAPHASARWDLMAGATYSINKHVDPQDNKADSQKNGHCEGVCKENWGKGTS